MLPHQTRGVVRYAVYAFISACLSFLLPFSLPLCIPLFRTLLCWILCRCRRQQQSIQFDYLFKRAVAYRLNWKFNERIHFLKIWHFIPWFWMNVEHLKKLWNFGFCVNFTWWLLFLLASVCQIFHQFCSCKKLCTPLTSGTLCIWGGVEIISQRTILPAFTVSVIVACLNIVWIAFGMFELSEQSCRCRNSANMWILTVRLRC